MNEYQMQIEKLNRELNRTIAKLGKVRKNIEGANIANLKGGRIDTESLMAEKKALEIAYAITHKTIAVYEELAAEEDAAINNSKIVKVLCENGYVVGGSQISLLAEWEAMFPAEGAALSIAIDRDEFWVMALEQLTDGKEFDNEWDYLNAMQDDARSSLLQIIL